MKTELQTTERNKLTGAIRIMLAILFLMTGIMKLTMAKYGHAWSVQLIEARFPFYEFIYWFVPIFEVIIGMTLFLGYMVRLSSIFVVFMMFVAIYVHLTVYHPEAFPAQPQEPYMPILAIILALFVFVKGAGSWSIDLKQVKDQQ